MRKVTVEPVILGEGGGPLTFFVDTAEERARAAKGEVPLDGPG
jgi:hypothetical protein